MAVDVIFTIASRSLRILGSGTFSTCTVLRPDQTFARISGPRLLELGGVERLGWPLLELMLEQLTLRCRFRARYLAGLDALLEALEIVLDLRQRLAADE